MAHILVTGANTGIGLATVEALAARGDSVVMANRSAEKTRPVLDALKRQYPAADLRFLQIDLADLASVRRAAAEFLATGQPLDVLINNAGMAGANGITPNGVELTIAVNHLGPYLLTQLLLPTLQAAPQGRIVNVASQAHRMVKAVDWDSVSRPTEGGFKMYGLSKLFNILHAKELARRLAGTRVTTYSLHPGVVASDIWRRVPQPFRSLIMLFMITNEKGAKTSVYCATTPALASVSGRYYDKSREIAPSALADDTALATKLFEWSDGKIGQG
jgi:dehydrogenase/reductase SDR family protein 13